MKVFISWSGEASRRVGDLLRKYLPCMIQDVVPFMSQHDLSSGRRWSEQLSKELEQSDFGIVCLTPDNLQSAWILFEAGALTRHVEGRACCLLMRGLGPADVSGPLSQFQNRVFSRDGFRKLVYDINALLEKSIESTSLQMIFDKWWSDLDQEVEAALADPMLVTPAERKRDQGDLLEELLLRVRAVQHSLESRAQAEPDESTSVRDALRYSLDRTFARLTQTQLSMLRSFVTPAGTARVVDPDEMGRYSRGDVDALLASSLLLKRDDGRMVIHDLVAHYVADRLSGPSGAR